jgi:hypothetical protein
LATSAEGVMPDYRQNLSGKRTELGKASFAFVREVNLVAVLRGQSIEMAFFVFVRNFQEVMSF